MDDTQFERLRGTRLTREVLTKNAILTGLDESAAVANFGARPPSSIEITTKDLRIERNDPDRLLSHRLRFVRSYSNGGREHY